MAKRNGGIIGPNNPTGPFSAGGVWRLEDAFNAQKAGTWPLVLGYQIPNSLRFNSGSSDYLTKTFGSNGTRTTWTYSLWIKRANLGANTRIITASDNATFDDFFRFTSSDTIQWDFNNSSASLITTQVFRDVSAWYHIVVACDTTQATSSNRMKLYVNGSEITALGTATYPSQNSTGAINSTVPQNIGVTNSINLTQFYSGYMSEINFIDGQQLTPSSFGQTDATTGIWTPKAYTGSFGTNGFYLKFQDSSALGDDTSGNGNDFTVNNLTSVDQSTDTCTNNFCTLNPLFTFVTTAPTYSDGNLTILGNVGYNTYANGTFMVSKGKWYFETTCTDNDTSIGVKIPTSNSAFNSSGGGFYGFLNQNGNKITDGVSSASQSAGSNNDILQLALDMDNNKLWVGRNGTYFASGNPSAGTGEFISSLPTELVPSFQNYNNTMKFNFGSPPFTISSGNADANGFGNFEYAVPSGYYSLCTKNLAIYG